MRKIVAISVLVILLLNTFGAVCGTEDAKQNEGTKVEHKGSRSASSETIRLSKSTRVPLTEPCRSSVQVIDGVPRLVVDGKPMPITGYYGCVGVYFDNPNTETNEAEEHYEKYIRHIDYAAKGMLNIINLDIYWGGIDMSDAPPSSPEEAAARCDWSKIDSIMDYAASKGVYVIILFRWRPYLWWYTMNNCENYYYCTQRNNTAFIENSGRINGSVLMPSFAAPNLLEYADEVIKSMIKRYKDHPALLGWKLCLGFTTENNYPGGGYYNSNGWFDYSPYMKEEFRSWLQERYNNDLNALRDTWNNSTVTFDTAEPPQPPKPDKNLDNTILNGPGDTRRQWYDWQLFRLEMKKRERDHFAALYKKYDPNHVVVAVPGSPLPGGRIIADANELIVDYYDYATNPNIDGVLICPHIDLFEGIIQQGGRLYSLIKFFHGHGKFAYIKLEKWKDPVPPNSIESVIYFFAAMGAGILWDMGGIPAFGELTPPDYPEFSSEYTEEERAIINRSWYLIQTLPQLAPRKEKFALIDPAPLCIVDNQESGYTQGIYLFSSYKGRDRSFTSFMLGCAGLEFDLIHAGEVIANPDILKNYKAVAVVDVFRMNDTLVDVLADYRKSGGGLFIVGRTGIFDEYGNQNFTKLQKLLGISTKISEYKVNIYDPQDRTWSFVSSDNSGLIRGIEGETPENYNFYHIPFFDYTSEGYKVIGYLDANPEVATVGYKGKTVFWFSRLGWDAGYKVLRTEGQFNMVCQFLRNLYDFYGINHDECEQFEINDIGGWYKFLRSDEQYHGNISFDLTCLDDYDPTSEYIIYNWSNMTPIAKLAPKNGKLTTNISLESTIPYLLSITKCTPYPSFVAAEWAIYNDVSWNSTQELFILNVSTKEKTAAKVSIYLAGKEHDGYTIQIKDGELLASQKDEATDTLLIEFIPHTNSTSIYISFDKTPPTISDIKRIPEAPTDLDNVTIIANVSDVSGIAQVCLLYSNGSGWVNSTMSRTTVWEGTIPKQNVGTVVQYKIYAEDSFGNNVASKIYQYTVKPWDLVDLSVLNVTIEPKRLVEGETANINVSLYNDEGLDAEDVLVELIIDSSTVASRRTMVPANKTTSITFNWIALAGLHNITIKADPENSIWELNETNNNFTIEIKVYTPPDLALDTEDLSIEPEAPRAGDMVNISATIYNLGETNATDLSVDFYVDDEVTCCYNLSITAASNKTITFNWTAIAGAHNLTIRIDPNNMVREMNEDNNNATVMVIVEDKAPAVLPDLAVFSSDIKFSNDVPSEGEDVYINITVRNLGDAEVLGALVKIYIDNATVNETNITLRPHQSKSFVLKWRCVKGNHTIQVEIDPQDLIKESNETNNIAERTITVRSVEKEDEESADYSWQVHLVVAVVAISLVVVGIALVLKRISRRKYPPQHPPSKSDESREDGEIERLDR